MNGAAVNTGVHVSFHSMVLSAYIPGVGLQDRVVALFLVFKEHPNCSP